jgi:hypothetical protein
MHSDQRSAADPPFEASDKVDETARAVHQRGRIIESQAPEGKQCLTIRTPLMLP